MINWFAALDRAKLAKSQMKKISEFIYISYPKFQIDILFYHHVFTTTRPAYKTMHILLVHTRYDLSSLRILGTVGEPINPEAWLWYHEAVGQGRCPVVDTFWQTETVSVCEKSVYFRLISETEET